jgi:hypothetical protein
LTRRGLARTGGLLVAGAAMRALTPADLAAQETPAVADALNALITLEAFTVTFYGAARGRGNALKASDDVKNFLRAAQCEEDAHFHFFEAAGAVPSTTSFTIPDKQIANQRAFLTALLPVETLLVGAYMAAARAFAAANAGRLVEIAYQIGVVEAQHQALLKLYLDDKLPSDRAYAAWMFNLPTDAVANLEVLGYIDGKGKSVGYPGPVDRYCRGVTGLVPETTEDQPGYAPVPAASPVAAARGRAPSDRR